jgi:two-component system sensor histidine kinase UhpB
MTANSESGRQAASAAPPPASRCRLRALWSRISLRSQLLLAFLLIDLAAALIGGSVIVIRAREATTIEMRSSLRLAELALSDTIKLMEPHASPDQILKTLPQQLRFTRHVRVRVKDAMGIPIADRREGAQIDEKEPAPAWFAALIAPPEERHELPVIIQHRKIGSVDVVGEPQDEIAEVWGHTFTLAGLAFVVNAVAAGVLYFMFGRILGPLTQVCSGLSNLEKRRYKMRLKEPPVRELAEIVRRFNALAEVLDATHRENAELSRRLIEVEDDERRRIALELHDEFGPCLFGLKTNAHALAGLSSRGALPAAALGEIKELAGVIVEIAERMQMTNRHLLNSLRPMALGHVPLGDLLDTLVEGFIRLYPGISFSLAAPGIESTYGDRIDLTIYRCIQESLTNAVRHAGAAEIAVILREETYEAGEESDQAPRRLALDVRDSGRGMAPDARLGFGLSGMQERVKGLGGEWSLDASNRSGARIKVRFPITSAKVATLELRDKAAE